MWLIDTIKDGGKETVRKLVGLIIMAVLALFWSSYRDGRAADAKGIEAYERTEVMMPKLDTLCFHVKTLEQEPEKWKNAAFEVIEKQQTAFDNQRFKDSVALYYAIKDLKDK